MANALARQVEQMIQAATDQGFRVKDKKAGVMVMGDGAGSVMLHRTPSDTRGVNNARSRLRRIGVAI